MRGASSGTKSVIRVALRDSTRGGGTCARRGHARSPLAEPSPPVLRSRHGNRAPAQTTPSPSAATGDRVASRECSTPLSRALLELERQSAAGAAAQGGALGAGAWHRSNRGGQPG